MSPPIVWPPASARRLYVPCFPSGLAGGLGRNRSGCRRLHQVISKGDNAGAVAVAFQLIALFVIGAVRATLIPFSNAPGTTSTPPGSNSSLARLCAGS
jgi:hypothetical protein